MKNEYDIQFSFTQIIKIVKTSNHNIVKFKKYFFNFFIKMQQRQSKLKTQNLKTQYTFNGTVCELQFGKPVRLPYIKKPRYTHKNQTRLSQQKDFTKTQERKPRQSNMQLSSQLNLMTLQEIQLCQNIEHSLQRKKSTSKFLPKISFNLKKQKPAGFPTQMRVERINSEQAISKVEFWQNVGAYNIGPLLGRGSYSIVRLAKNENKKKFAVKIYPKSQLQDGDRKRNLQRQIQILYEINHSNLLKFYQTIYTQQNVYIVTQLLDGVSLTQYMRTNNLKKFSEPVLRQIMKQVFGAFDYLHKKNICHRDVKMENILIDEKLNVKIIDFGFSVKLAKGQVLNDFCGTPHYISPEVIKKKGYYPKEADVWSLGVLLYKLAIGTFPFKGLNEKNLFNKILKGQYKEPEQISSQLVSLINRMLQVDWQKRPPIQEILEDKWFNMI